MSARSAYIGMSAAWSVRDGAQPRDLDARALRRHLEQRGAMLAE